MSDEGATTVHGWGCTPTDEAPQTSIKPRYIPAAFVRGWQRTTLYAIIIVLMLLVFLNIALTLWIIASLRLSMKSVGPIKILKGGIQVDGETFVTGRLVASSLSSRPGQPIVLQSHRNFSIFVSDPELEEYSRLSIKRDSLVCGGRNFEVTDGRGNTVFKASREEVRISADAFVVDGVGGLNVKGAVQSPNVRAPPGSDLLLESQTRRLDLRAPQSIYLESRAGNIDISSHNSIKLDSLVGAIKIDAPNVIISNLREATRLPDSVTRSRNIEYMKVYQVCVCASGKMFLAAADGLCAAHSQDHDLCR